MEVREADAKYLVAVHRRPSELGALPEDWDVIELATRATIQSGIAKNANAALRDAIVVPYLRVANVQDGYLDLREVALIEIERSDLNRYAVLPGDVLMNEGGDLDKLGRGAIWRGQINQCVHQNHVFVVRCKTGLVPEYLNAWTASAQARRYFLLAGRQTTNLASINKTSLGELTVAVPPTETEQREIAAAISEADALIDSLEQLLTKKRQIKQGAMQELLTGKRRLPGFHDAWAPRSMADLFEFSGGYSASRDQLGDVGACYLHYGDIHLSSKSYIDLDREHHQMPRLEVDLREVSSTALLKNGDVVFVDASEDDQGVSKHVVIHCKVARALISGLHTIVARPKSDELVDLYKRYCFQAPTVQAQFRFYAVGTKVSGVSKGNIGKIVLSVPSPAEQAEIAACLSEIDAETCALEDRLTKARALKQAIAQALLTGRIRLVESTV